MQSHGVADGQRSSSLHRQLQRRGAVLELVQNGQASDLQVEC